MKKEIIDMGDNCKVMFDEGGNLKIIEGCKGKIINPTEIALFHRVTEDFRREEKDEIR